MKQLIGVAIDYGSSRIKVYPFHLGRGSTTYGKSAGSFLGHNQEHYIPSAVRIKNRSWEPGCVTRGRSAAAQQPLPGELLQYRVDDSTARGWINIFESKRHIGVRLEDVDVDTASQEYGGLALVADEHGYMAFQLDALHGFSITPQRVLELILEHIFKKADGEHEYTLGLLVLTVPVSATEDVKALYEAAPKRVLEKFPGLLKDGAMPEVLIVSEPVAGMCDHFAAAPDMCPMGDAGAEGEQQQEHMHLGMDVGDGTTDCCLMTTEHQPSAGGRRAMRVLGAHGNSHLGAADVKKALLNRVLAEAGVEVPLEFANQFWRGVTRAMEALSRCGAADDAWDDWEGITDSEEIRECLGQIVITRRMVHEAAAAFKDAFIQSIRSTLSVAKVQAAEVTHVVLMGGGSELPCVRQAISAVLGDVRVTKGQGGGSTQIARGATAYALQLLEQRRSQRGEQPAREQAPLQLGRVTMPVGQYICTKVTFRGHCLHPERQHPDYPISVAYLQQTLKRCLVTSDPEERVAQEQMLDAVTAHYENMEDPLEPWAPMPKRLPDFEVYLPLIDCTAVTPTSPAAITFMPCESQQRSYTISFYAADALFSDFCYIGGRRVEVPAAAKGAAATAAALTVVGEVWVDDRQRLCCTARLPSGQELPVRTVWDKDAVQRRQRRCRQAQFSPVTLQLLRQLCQGGAPEAAAQEMAADAAAEAAPATAGDAAAKLDPGDLSKQQLRELLHRNGAYAAAEASAAAPLPVLTSAASMGPAECLAAPPAAAGASGRKRQRCEAFEVVVISDSDEDEGDDRRVRDTSAAAATSVLAMAATAALPRVSSAEVAQALVDMRWSGLASPAGRWQQQRLARSSRFSDRTAH